MIVDFIEGYDATYLPIFQASWNSWEEGGWVVIFEKNKKLFAVEGGHCVMAKDNSTIWDRDSYEITQEEALRIMLEWEDEEDEF